MIQGMPQDPKVLVAESLLEGRVVATVDLVEVGIQRCVLETRVVVHQLPGIDLFGSIDHLGEDRCRKD